MSKVLSTSNGPASSNLEVVNFHGDELIAIHEGDEVYVGVRRVCESLEVSYSKQLRKLKEAAWSTVALKATVADDGKIRDIAVIPLDSLPMWLATIQPGRVAEQVRKKLEVFQKEARDALARHFFGRPATADAGDPLSMALKAALANRESVLRLEAEQARQAAKLESIAAQVDDVVEATQAALTMVEDRQNHLTLKAFAAIHDLPLSRSQFVSFGLKIAAACRGLGLKIHRIEDIRYGLVNAYPREVLDGFLDEMRAAAQPNKRTVAALFPGRN